MDGRRDPAFARFVPACVRHAAGPGARVHLDGTCLSVDVAGFTTLTERFAAHGSEGAEELSALMGHFFAPAVDHVVAAGGDVLGFAGDSLLAVFPGSEEPTERQARAAGDAILGSARGIAGLDTLVGPVDVRVRLGMASGVVTVAVAGTDRERRVVASGPGVDAAVGAQQRARVGALESVVAGATGAIAVRAEGATAHAADETALARFVPGAVVDRMRSGGIGLVDELRTVTTAFIGLPGGLDLDGVVGTVPAVLDVVEHFGGTLLDVDCTDKGAAVLVAFGAPVSHGEDATRAMACLQELSDRHDAALRIGAATGACFTGIVGSDARAAYTVCGDSVNLSARLMQHAGPGEIVADGPTRDRAGPSFGWADPQTLTVKGKEATVDAAALAAVTSPGAATPPDRDRPPFVGRDQELGVLRDALRDARRGRGRTVVVSGVAGIGKSRLVDALGDEARALGVTVVCDRFDVTLSRSPYAGTRVLWRALLDVDDEVEISDVVARLHTRDRDATALEPVLAGVLGIGADHGAPASSPDEPGPGREADASGETVRALFVDLLADASASRPWLLVLDDCHWADAASRALVAQIAERADDLAVCLVLLTRGDNPLEHVLTDAVDLVELHELEPADAETLARTLLASDAAGSADAVGIAERAGGNPLFLVELTRWMEAGGPDAGGADAPPTTLGALVLATVDQLSPAEQATIRSASVLGRSFQGRELVGSFGRDQLPDVESALDGLTRAGHLPRAAAPDAARATGHAAAPVAVLDATYTFRSDTLRESLYETLSHANRRRLHEAAGAWLEEEFAGDIDPHLDRLAHHFGRSANTEKQRTYFALAGRRSARLFANDDAIGHFEKLVALLGDAAGASELRELGELYAHVGRPVDAEELLRRAVAVDAPRSDPFALAALGRLLAEHQLRLGEARVLLTDAVGRAEVLDDDRAHLAVLSGLAIALGQAGDLEAAEAAGREHLVLAERLGDQLAEVTARTDIAVNVEDQGRLDESYEGLLAAWRLVEERPGVHRWRIESYLFRVCERRADLREAVAWLARAAETARTIGHEPGLALNLGDEARLRLNLGDPDGASTCCLAALRLAVGLRDSRVMRQCLLTLAALMPDGIDPGELQARAEAVARVEGTALDLAGALLQRAQAERARGSIDVAAEAIAEASELDTTTREMRDQAELDETLVLEQQGDLTVGEARRRLRDLADHAVTEHQRVDAVHELAKLSPDDPLVQTEAVAAIASLYERAPYLYLSGFHWGLTGAALPGVALLDPVPPDPHAPTVADLLRRVDVFVADRRAARRSLP